MLASNLAGIEFQNQKICLHFVLCRIVSSNMPIQAMCHFTSKSKRLNISPSFTAQGRSAVLKSSFVFVSQVSTEQPRVAEQVD